VIVEERVNYQLLDEMIEKKSKEQMGEWLSIVSDMNKAAWLPDRSVKVLTPTGWKEVKWSGFADDLRQIVNQGNTVLSTARQIGTTTFLASVACEQSFKKKVCLVSARKGDKDHISTLVKSFQHDPENIELHTFASFLKIEVKDKTLPFDLVIVDNAAYLPYKDNEEMYHRLRLCPHVIIASCPAQETGMFYKMRTEANMPEAVFNFAGFDLPWNLPLRQRDPKELFDQMQTLMKNLGDRFDNEFLCRFRPVSV
jgi:hypothetical protein